MKRKKSRKRQAALPVTTTTPLVVEQLEKRIVQLSEERDRERQHRERLEWERAERARRERPRTVIFMSDAGPCTVTTEQLAALQRASENGALGRKLRGFATAADMAGNVLLDLSGHHLMGDPVWGRKMAFALLYTSEIAHMTRKQMGSKLGYQHCESLFHCNCYFGLRTPQHAVAIIGKCCFCDRLSSDDDRDPIAALDDGRPA
jgi:hypothetical protein